MMGRAAPVAVVVLLIFAACYEDPLEVLGPDKESRLTTSSSGAASGIFHGEESFVAGNPMMNIAGGPSYNFGYYSYGPDAGSSHYNSSQARIHIPHDPRLATLDNFSFEAWIRPSPRDEYKFALVAMNSEHMFNSAWYEDYGYFLLTYRQDPKGPGPDYTNRITLVWEVASYKSGYGWSSVNYSHEAKSPSPDPETGAETHVVGVHENNVIKLYVDGGMVASMDISGETGLLGPDGQPTTRSGFRQDLTDIHSWAGGTPAKPLLIAGAPEGAANPDQFYGFNGSIGESAFYRRALAPAEIQEHYQIGTGIPPTEPDNAYDPYRDLVLSHAPAGYWRHRESELHGLSTIESEQVVDASGNDWHGVYRVAGTAQTEELYVSISLAADSVGPVLGNCFDAVKQTTRANCKDNHSASREDTLRLIVFAKYQPSGRSAAGAELRLSAQPLHGSGGHVYNHEDRPTGTFFMPTEETDSSSGGQRGEILLTLSDSGASESVIYRTSGVSGLEVLTAEVSHEGAVDTASDTVTIRHPGLMAWERQDSLYYFKDQDYTYHAQRHGNTNHFAMPGFEAPLLALFKDYQETYADTSKFKITDMSLVWGGLLDIDTLAWSNPHQTHREGRNADLGLDNLPKNRHNRFKGMCEKQGLGCVIEGDHFHVFYPGS